VIAGYVSIIVPLARFVCFDTPLAPELTIYYRDLRPSGVGQIAEANLYFISTLSNSLAPPNHAIWTSPKAQIDLSDW
jgi:hypothetical protein